MFKQFFELFKKDFLIIALLVLTAFAIRTYAIYGNSILFYFDQARDATVSRSIIEKGDIKTQGPSSSGSNDLLYHGVLYYYVISPVYVLFAGNPFYVSLFLGLLNSITIVPLYLLTKKITGYKAAAVFACILFGLSAHSVHAGVWLSNPSLTPLLVATFYYLLWVILTEKKYKLIPFLFLVLGLNNQAFLYSIYLWLSVVFVAVLVIKRELSRRVLILPTVVGIVAYVLSIGTMIYAEYRLVLAGLLNLESVGQMSQTGGDIFEKINTVYSAFAYNLSLSFFPNQFSISLVLVAISTAIFLMKSKFDSKVFVIVWVMSPLLLGLFLPRNDKHTLLGLSIVFYIVIAFLLLKMWSKVLGKIAVIIVLVGFAFTNISFLNYAKRESISMFVIQRGADLNEQLKMIDYTYAISKGKPFTISTLTNPYSINTTWAYLYNWYGAKKYGYMPDFYGSDQTGLVGADLIKLNSKYGDIHFTIYEPLEGLPENLNKKFSENQSLQVRNVTDKKEFGAIVVESRIK